jgi:hypothetical protein
LEVVTRRLDDHDARQLSGQGARPNVAMLDAARAHVAAARPRPAPRFDCRLTGFDAPSAVVHASADELVVFSM